MTLPSLEQLRFSNLFPFADYGLEGERTIKETFNRVWTGLKAVIVDSPSEILDLDQAFGLNSLVSINRGENIRYIEIAPWFNEHAGHTLIDRNRHSGELLSSSTGNGILGDLAQPNTFSNLEALRMKQTVMDGAALEPILQRSLANGKLRELDINFDTPGMNEAYGPASCRHLQSYDWLRGSASIRSMRVHNFRFTQHPRGDAELPLPSFLASLPNLEILEIGSSYYDEAELASIIVAVLKGCKNLKRVYQSYVKGWMLDGITAVAKERDIQLVFGERPREWPVGILD